MRTLLGLALAILGFPAPAADAPKPPEMTAPRTDVQPFEFQPAKVPFYPAGQKWGTLAEPISKMQKPLPAAESLKHFVTPKGFEVRTFVTEDQLGGKPLAMAWDERGRLWVSLTLDYPNELHPAGGGRDRIVCCEDADGDGVCDRVTPFADGLSIPTSLLPYAGGLVVLQAPHTLFLKDTDGDGKADLRQVLFTGWGIGDTHAGPSSLRYGLDNWVYGAVGYSAFKGTVAGEAVGFRQGFYRFKLDREPGDAHKLKTTKLEFLRSTSNNTWGLGFDESGQLFGSTANDCPIVHMPIPNRYYEKVRGLTPAVLKNIAPDSHFEPATDKVRQMDWHGKFTAAAGLTVYTARTYPPEYWNRAAFVCEPTGHLAATFVLDPNGADTKARLGWNLVASDDEWSAPIQTEVGPDGHVWVLDWYNYIVQHNPTPQGYKTGKGNAYETDLRDKARGRVYRVVYTGAKPEPRVNLKDATPEKLVETLKHHNMGWRLHAQRLLVERGKLTRELTEQLEDVCFPENYDTTPSPSAVNAIWTAHALGHLLGSFKDKRDDAQAATVLTRAGAKGLHSRIHTGFGRYVNGHHAALALLLALTDAPKDDPDPVRYGQELLGDWPLSAYPALADAATILAMTRAADFLAEANWSDHSRGSSTVFFRAVHLAAGQLAVGGSGPEVSRAMVGLAGKWKSPEVRAAAIKGLAAAWPAGRTIKLDPEAETAVVRLLPTLPVGDRTRFLKLLSAWGVKGLEAQVVQIVAGLVATAADEKADDAARLDAAKQAVEFRPGDAAIADKLLAAVTPQASPALAAGLLEVVADGKAKPVAVVAKLKGLSPSARTAALRAVIARPATAAAFLDAVEKGDLRFDMLALDQKTILAAHPDKALAERAKKLLALGGGLPDPNRQKVIDEFHAVVAKAGDPANGKKMFVQHCAKCHKHGGEGQQIGPDLSGMAAHPKGELLVHVLDPSRSVEGNYKAYVAKTADGRVLTGLLAAETRTSVELIDAENRRVAVRRDDLDELTESPKSLMPEGFEKQMKPAELGDLLEFLARPGRFLPLPLDKVATAVSTRGLFNGLDVTSENMAAADWKPREVAGVPFALIDPHGDRVPNVVLLYSRSGAVPPTMPKAVSLPCHTAAKAVHLLGGVAGWGFPVGEKGTVSMIVRLHYSDGPAEDHPLRNGVEVADYIRRVDVPGSAFAFPLAGGKQVRLVTVVPKRPDRIDRIELVKGPDATAPVVMAVTVETAP